MRYTITGKNIEVTASLKDIIQDKLDKLEKFFNSDAIVNVTLSVERNFQKIEVTIPIKGSVLRAEEQDESMYAAIDMVVDKLERQLVKHREKIIDRHRQSGSFKTDYLDSPIEDDEEDTMKIVRTKKFAMKPMDAVEACMELELLGHDFFVFRNADTDEVNVVYKRKQGSYGLIEPQI